MKTLRELKKIFIGELIAAALILPFAAIMNGDIDMTFMEFLTNYVFDIDELGSILQFAAFELFVTYTIYSLYKAVENDIMEIRDYFRNKKTSN